MTDNTDEFFSFNDNYDILIDYTIKNKEFTLKTQTEVITPNYINAKGYPSKRQKYTLGKTEHKYKTCRFCGKDTSSATFNKIAHAIPELLGNNVLLSDYECDECNERFSKLENDFASSLGELNRIKERIKGKKGYPKYKSDDGNSEVILNKNLINIKIMDNSFEKPYIDFDRGLFSFTGKKQKYTPVAVYKCLTKILLTLLPEKDFTDNKDTFLEIIKWLNHYPHNSGNIVLPFWYAQYFSRVFPLRAVILKRKSESTNIFSYVFILMFKHTYIQTILYDKKIQINSLNTKDYRMEPFPICLEYGINLKPNFYNLSSNKEVINETNNISGRSKGASYFLHVTEDEYENFNNMSPSEKAEYSKKHSIKPTQEFMNRFLDNTDSQISQNNSIT